MLPGEAPPIEQGALGPERRAAKRLREGAEEGAPRYSLPDAARVPLPALQHAQPPRSDREGAQTGPGEQEGQDIPVGDLGQPTDERDAREKPGTADPLAEGGRIQEQGSAEVADVEPGG